MNFLSARLTNKTNEKGIFLHIIKIFLILIPTMSVGKDNCQKFPLSASDMSSYDLKKDPPIVYQGILYQENKLIILLRQRVLSLKR